MTEIEKLARHHAEVQHGKISKAGMSEYHEFCIEDFQAGAHAVIELIRERMPEPRHVELTEGMPLGLSAPANAGYNAYRSEILKLLEILNNKI